MPDGDSLIGPFSGIHPPTSTVEPITVGIRRGSLDPAAGIHGLAGGIYGAIAGEQFAREAGVGDTAPWVSSFGVQDHVVFGLVIDAFDYVDFAVVGPVCAYCPALITTVVSNRNQIAVL